jgi:hypothetical protein
MALVVPTPTPTATPVVSLSPSPSASPTASPQSQVAVIVHDPVAPHPTLTQQLGQIDPLFWAAFAGALIIPWLLQGVKKIAGLLGAELARRAKVLLSLGLNAANGLLLQTVTGGVLGRLNSPALEFAIYTAVSFVVTNVTYEIVARRNQDATVTTGAPDLIETGELPMVENP